MKQLVEAISYMHTKKNVVHRDLKLENLLIDQFNNIKIADFGFATETNISNLKKFCGTAGYMAPEFWELGTETDKSYDGRDADIFSLGVVLFTMIQGFHPFKSSRSQDQYYRLLTNKKYDFYWQNVRGSHLSP